MTITYRPSQQKIIQYTHGTMGIAAVAVDFHAITRTGVNAPCYICKAR